jgi:hypothetical protein
MRTRGIATAQYHTSHLERAGMQGALQASSLCMVTQHELQELRAALARGGLPLDFEVKLARLAQGDLTHRFLAQSCQLFMALVVAARDGCFREAGQFEVERLLRVLAYVRKDDDAIADYKPGGYMDDQREVRAAITELHPLLQSFKAWRLRHQVPGMWLAN